MKTILAILLLTFNFSSYADFYIAACDRPLGDYLTNVSCENRSYNNFWSGKTEKGVFSWNKKIMVNSVEEVDAKINTVKTTLVESINNLGTELKTGIVIKLLKEDDEFRKIIEEIVEAKIKKKSTGEEPVK